MIEQVKNLRWLSLLVAGASMFVLFRYGMAPDRYETIILTAGTALFAGLATFFATFVFGAISYPRGSGEARLSLAVLVFLLAGLAVVGGSALRSLLVGFAGAA